METTHKIAIGGAAALAAAIAVAPDEQAHKTPTSCVVRVGERGVFEVPDDAGRCDLVFEQPTTKPRKCQMWPVVENSIGYQWSYEVTETGAIVRGLKRGARVHFECKE